MRKETICFEDEYNVWFFNDLLGSVASHHETISHVRLLWSFFTISAL